MISAHSAIRGLLPGILGLLGLLATGSAPARAQQPILEIRLPGVGQVLVQARMTEDGILELPTQPLEELTGEDLDGGEYMSLADLRVALGPGVEIEYDTQRAAIRIRDSLGRLEASRQRFDHLRAEQTARPASFNLAGPHAALTAEADGSRLIEGGWNFGRFSVGAAHSSVSGTRWNASANLFRQAYATYRDSDDAGPRFGLRWASGRTFVETVYETDTRDFRARAATSTGPWTFYAQDDGTAAVSHRSVVQVTVGHTPEGFATRLSYGRHPSALFVPRVF